MKKIILENPVVVSFPEDMPEGMCEDIMDLVKYRKCIRVKNGDVELIDSADREPGALTGIEGAKAFCWVYGVELEYVTEIDIEDIVAHCDSLGDLSDIIYLARRVDVRNRRLKKLRELGAPSILIDNESRMLQERVEQLAHNCHCDEPVTEKTERGEEILRSLSCIGYEL